VEDALDGAVLAVVAEEAPKTDGLASTLLLRTTLDGDAAGNVAMSAVKNTMGRLRIWSLIEENNDETVVTPFGASVYRSGFSPADAVRTRRDGEQYGEFQILDEKLPSSPREPGSYDALVLLMEMLRRTRNWAQIERSGITSARQAALYLNDWTRGTLLSQISENRGRGRLYLQSLFEGALAPMSAWFFLSLSVWLEGGPFDGGPDPISNRLQGWAEFAWFGAPQGPALRVLRRDFEGLWHRDDALVVCHMLGPTMIGRMLVGKSRYTPERLEEELRRGASMTVDSSAKIAKRLLNFRKRSPSS